MYLRSIVGVCASAALAVAVVACGERDENTMLNEQRTETTETEGTAGRDSLRVADIVGDPTLYDGQTVTIEADVEEVLGPHAFVLDEDAPLEGGIDNDLLVFSRESGQLAEMDDQWMNDTVRVTGTVGEMSVVEVEREVGWDLDPQMEVELEGRRAVLIAESVQRVEN